MESEIFRGPGLVVSDQMFATVGIGQESNN